MQEIRVNPTLVVGVGGTGCHIAKMLRKMVERDVAEADRSRIPMRFIGIDTDQGDLAAISGEEAPLHYAMPISGRAHAVGGEGDQGPTAESFRAWMPRARSGKLIVRPEDLASGAGAQGKRLLGRYAFKYFAPNHFIAAQQQVEALRGLCNNPILAWKGREYVASDNIEVFVVCSLAGGTGSGSFLDAVAMCHRLCFAAAQGVTKTINLVLVTPSAFEYVAARQNRPVQLATAYACLKDLDNLLEGKVDLAFEFHGDQDAKIRDRFVDSVYLLGRHGPAGTVSDLPELFRLLAIQLYAMIGTPLGASFGSVANNNTRINEIDRRGGRKRYSTFGLVGIDYDLETERHRRACRIAAGVTERLLNGGASPTEEELEKASADLVRAYRGSSSAPRAIKLADPVAASLKPGDSTDDAAPKQVARQLEGSISSAADAVVRGRIASEATRHAEAWRKEFVDSLVRTTEQYGIAGADAVLSAAERMLEDDFQMPTAVPRSASRVLEDAVSKLRQISSFTWLARRSEANRQKLEVLGDLPSNLALAVRHVASDVLNDKGSFGPKSACEEIRKYRKQLSGALSVLVQAKALLEDEAKRKAPDTTALARSSVVYDIVEPTAAEEIKVTDAQIGECATTWMKADEQDLLSRLQPTSPSGKALARPTSLRKELLDAATPAATREATQHILDLLTPDDSPESIERKLRRTLRNLTPLSHADMLDQDEQPYNTARALVPDRDGQDHPKFDQFRAAFTTLCTELGHEQPGCEVFSGPPNRLLIAKWCLGFALNDAAYTSLPDWRDHFVKERARNDFLEVDDRWQREPGPGMGFLGTRKLAWALGLAYGLIAQHTGNTYYNNLRTRQVFEPSVKGTPEEHEVDAEFILRQISSGRSASDWMADVVQGPCHQTLAKQRIPLAFEPNWKPDGLPRLAHDRMGKGRSVAMNAFLNNEHEDYSDVEDGISVILAAYLVSRGHGTMRTELSEYQNRLRRLRFSDDRMAAQIEEEIAMIERALHHLDDSGTLGLRRV